MPGPGGPVNDLIRMLLDEAGHSFGARPSAGLRNRMNDIDFGSQDHLPSRNVTPGPGSGLREIQSPDFEDRIEIEAFRQQLLKDTKARSADPLDLMQGKGPKPVPTGNELFVFVTNPSGKRIRVAGPFPDEASAQATLDRLAKNSKGVTLDIGPWTPQPE